MNTHPVIGPPPQAVSADLNLLRAALDHPAGGIPSKLLDRNLIFGNWNLSFFGEVHDAWISTEIESWMEKFGKAMQIDPKWPFRRDYYFVSLVAEIVSRFDIMALTAMGGFYDQYEELQYAELDFVKVLRLFMGGNWSVLVPDEQGHSRIAVFYDNRRIKLSGLVGELGLFPQYKTEYSKVAAELDLSWQPYVIGFDTGLDPLTLVVLKFSEEEKVYASRLLDWLYEEGQRPGTWIKNPMLVGSFGLKDHSFTESGFDSPFNYETAWDTSSTGRFLGTSQLAWKKSSRHANTLLKNRNQGYFNTHAIEFKSHAGLDTSWHLSNAAPAWVEFSQR